MISNEPVPHSDLIIGKRYYSTSSFRYLTIASNKNGVIKFAGSDSDYAISPLWEFYEIGSNTEGQYAEKQLIMALQDDIMETIYFSPYKNANKPVWDKIIELIKQLKPNGTNP